MQPKGTAIRKRTQIASANRIMFLWIAGVSVIFGISLVAAIFLVQMLLFNEKVLQVKNQTVLTLDTNLSNAQPLRNNIQELNTNSALISSKAKSSDEPVQVILDALPSDANSLALGASLQDKLLAGIPGITLDSLQVEPVVGIESLSGDGSVIDNSITASPGSQNQITFSISVTGDETALAQVLVNLEKSIRTIDITTLKIENQGKTRSMTISARAFYEPVRTVKLTDEVIK